MAGADQSVKAAHRARCVEAERSLSRAFVTAYLLTANADQAERITLEGINSWNPNTETPAALFQSVMHATVLPSHKPLGSDSSSPTRMSLPVELQAVLRLAPRLRHCFILRILLGLPPQICAAWLNLSSRRVDQYTRAAVKALGARDPRSAVGPRDSAGT